MLPNYHIKGTGKGTAIVLSKLNHGLGDDIASLITLSELTKKERVVVFCDMSTPFNKEARTKMFTSVGCEVYDSSEISHNGWRSQNVQLEDVFESIYHLNQWSVWEVNAYSTNIHTPIQLFAKLLGVELPEHFSWIDTLNPVSGKSYVIYAPDSSGNYRRMGNQFFTWLLLKLKYGDVITFGVKESHFIDKDKFKKLGASRKRNERVSKWYQKLTDMLYYPMNSRKVHLNNFDEMLSLIYSAKVVIGSDNGVTNIAHAFGVPCISVWGMSEEKIGKQYEPYIIGLKTIISKRESVGCQVACNGNINRNFTNEKCKGKFQKAQCMELVTPIDILNSTKLIGV